VGPELPRSLERLLEDSSLGDIAGDLRASLVLGARYSDERTVNLSAPGVLGRWRGRERPTPTLSAEQSKTGGVPYREAGDPDTAGEHFLAQINFAEVDVPGSRFPSAGLIAFDTRPEEGISIRWYPQPAPEKALAAREGDLEGWERRVEFRPAWSFDVSIIERELEHAEQAGEDPGRLAALDRARVRAIQWLFESGATMGGHFPGGLTGPGPRQWLTGEPDLSGPVWELFRMEDAGSGLQLGDYSISVLISDDALNAESLERASALCWQSASRALARQLPVSAA
jgi:hypothetical protein